MKFNYYGFKAIYVHEMNRFIRTLGQSLLSPVISTSLYFVVFGSVIGGYIQKIDGVSYGSYIVPGLLMLTLFPSISKIISFCFNPPIIAGLSFCTSLIMAGVKSLPMNV